MKIIIDGKTEEKTYEEICEILGFIASSNFVEVTPKGEISFIAGNPNDIRALYWAAQQNGMVCDSALTKIKKKISLY